MSRPTEADLRSRLAAALHGLRAVRRATVTDHSSVSNAAIALGRTEAYAEHALYRARGLPDAGYSERQREAMRANQLQREGSDATRH